MDDEIKELLLELRDNVKSIREDTPKIEQVLIDNAKICKSLENIEKNSMKQFGALIGVIMALIGAKLISTPWYIDVAVILCLVSGAFLCVLLIAWWKEYSWPQRATRISGATLMIVSAITQIWVYQPGVENSPAWFAVVINALLIILSISLVWSGWKHLPNNGKDKCKYE